MSSVFGKDYRKIQLDGTLYMITTKPVPEELLKELEAGEGELFLTRIPKYASVEYIMEMAMEVGDVYKFRFKVDFSGNSRGYAYLQYMDYKQPKRAIEILKKSFAENHSRINVTVSNNKRKLLLINATHMTPVEVYQELRKTSRYEKLCVFEYLPRRYDYCITYRNNYEAAQAHHMLRAKISTFGFAAYINWIDDELEKKYFKVKCCIPLKLSTRAELLQALPKLKEQHLCFTINDTPTFKTFI